jgi:hypothetical protein
MSEKLTNQKIAPKRGRTKKKGNSSKLIILFAFVIVIAGILIWLFVGSPSETKVRNQVVTENNVDELIQAIEEEEGDLTPPGSYEVLMNTTWNFENGSAASSDAYIANSPANTNTMYFTIVLKDSREEVFSSPYLPVGSKLEGLTLDQELEAGEYDCVLTYHLVDDDYLEIGEVSVSLTVIIQN